MAVRFDVRRADRSLVDALKAARVLLQVNESTAELQFLASVDSPPESYACDDVDARPQGRTGVQFRIQQQTPDAERTLIKQVKFASSDERDRCLLVLNALRARDKTHETTRPRRSSIASIERLDDDAVGATTQDMAMNPHVVMLAGESDISRVHRVARLVMTPHGDRLYWGMTTITNYRVVFTPYGAAEASRSFEVPLTAIASIDRDGTLVRITGKDIRVVELKMHHAFATATAGSSPSRGSEWLTAWVRLLAPPTKVPEVFAFVHFAEKKATADPSAMGTLTDGWLLYSPLREFQRLGFLRASSSKKPVDTAEVTWRLLRNPTFRFSPTYPQLTVIPSAMTEEQLIQSARFRSRARLPSAVWRHPVNKSILARSAQPNYGLLAKRCDPDRVLLKAFRDSADPDCTGESPPLHIIDARDLLATKGNQVKGKGVENPDHYDHAIVEYIGICNLHKVRESFGALKELAHSGGKHFHSRLEKTKWMRHLMDILTGARCVAKILHEESASVLVHCSDGWNRTPQVASLAQLMLDPYYRTIRGFAVLIEKEWCAYGHKFADRIGVGKASDDEPNERSPVMIQFLDCVWQMTRQFPTAFEFNEKLLLHVSDALVSGLYGTFLYNTERERISEKVWERTESAWSPVLESTHEFANLGYRETNEVLYPRTDETSIALWEALVFRWDADRLPSPWQGHRDAVKEEEEEAKSPSAKVDGGEMETSPAATVKGTKVTARSATTPLDGYYDHTGSECTGLVTDASQARMVLRSAEARAW